MRASSRIPLQGPEGTPKTYGDCLAGGVNEKRPCAFKKCVHNARGVCALDVARENPEGLSQYRVARVMGVSRQKAKKIEKSALEKLPAHLREYLYERIHLPVA